MAARRRERCRQAWPGNLYETNGYYYWRDPTTGKNYGLGRDLSAAKIQATEANLHLAGLREKARLVDKLTGNSTRTMGALLVRYVEDLKDRGLAVNTLKTKAVFVRDLERRWENTPYSQISTAHLDHLLQEYVKAGKHRMAQAYRSFLTELGNKAIAIGWASHNPVAVTAPIGVVVKRARLTLDELLSIHQSALNRGDPWMARAIELGLVTGQRREDIALWKRDDIRDNRLWVLQGKTKNTELRRRGEQARIAIPLDLCLRAATETGIRVTWTLNDVISRCWEDNVASRYLLHHSKSRTMSKAGDPVWKDTVSKGFARARDKSGLDWGHKNPPTFHEIRSLSLRLWRHIRGRDFAQALAGHKLASTTDLYTDERGNWVMLRSA